MSAARVRRYPSDTTDREWMLIEPLLPVPAWLTPAGGRVVVTTLARRSTAANDTSPWTPWDYYWWSWTTASLQDRPAARALLTLLRQAHRGIRHIWADGGYSGVLIEWAKTTLNIVVEIVKKIVGQTTFVVLPRRWVVERTFSWITQARRNVRDYERLPQHSEAFINWSMITMMTRRLARGKTQATAT